MPNIQKKIFPLSSEQILINFRPVFKTGHVHHVSLKLTSSLLCGCHQITQLIAYLLTHKSVSNRFVTLKLIAQRSYQALLAFLSSHNNLKSKIIDNLIFSYLKRVIPKSRCKYTTDIP